jgi:hypothetical protein
MTHLDKGKRAKIGDMGAPAISRLARKTVDTGLIQMMKAVSLKEFGHTGCLGPIRLGMSRAQIQDAVGSPD